VTDNEMETGDQMAGDEPADAPTPGAIIGVAGGTITLRDPNAGDVSRANMPIVPGRPNLAELSAAIEQAVAEMGFAVSVRLDWRDQ